MQIEQLLYFKTINHYQRFSKAADSLFISQSALSKHIKALEADLGGQLFIRKHNSIKLTPFGAYISSYIDNIVADYDQLLQIVDNYSLNKHKKLRVASMYNMALYGIVKPIVLFEKQIPIFHVETIECDHAKIQELFDSNSTDICIGYQELFNINANYKIIPLKKEPLVFVTNSHHAEEMGWKEEIRLSDVKNEKYCFPREDIHLFTFYYSACKHSNFTPELTYSNVRLSTIKQYISVGMRCTLQLKSIAEAQFNTSEFTVLALSDAPTLTLSLLTEYDRLDQIGKRFVEYITEYYHEKP